MRKDAEAHAAEDRRKVELIEARNQADAQVFQIEKLLKDNADKIGENERKPVQAAIETVRQKMAGDDVQAMKQATSDLMVAAQGLHQFMQGGPRPSPGPSTDGSSSAGGKGKDDVIDAEFEVKK